MKKNYTYLELDDAAIQKYKEGGWVVEEVPTFSAGGNNPNDPEYKKWLVKKKAYENYLIEAAEEEKSNTERYNRYVQEGNPSNHGYRTLEQYLEAVRMVKPVKDPGSYTPKKLEKIKPKPAVEITLPSNLPPAPTIDAFIPEGYSYRVDNSRDGDVNDYLKGNKRITRDDWIKATGYSPTKYKQIQKEEQRHIKSPVFKTGGGNPNDPEYKKWLAEKEAYEKYLKESAIEDAELMEWWNDPTYDPWHIDFNNDVNYYLDFYREVPVVENPGLYTPKKLEKITPRSAVEIPTTVEPDTPTRVLPPGYSYKVDQTRDGDINDYLKGNKRISREEFITNTGYSPTQFREKYAKKEGERHITAPEFKNGGLFRDGGVVSEYGWDYKKVGDNYLAKKSGDTDWITAKGEAKTAIQNRVNFGDTQNIEQPSTPESTALNTEPPTQNITQSEFRGRPSIAELQQGLADNNYYLGPKGVDGFDGKFTQGALAAQKQGISAEEYNKRFESQELESLPGVTVPSTVVENATTGSTASRPVSARPSAAAERSLHSNAYEGDYGWQSGTPEDIKYYHKDDKYLGDDFSSSPVIDISDEIYSHADDFIIDYTSNQHKRSKKQSDMSTEMRGIHQEAGSCLKGALNCNQQMVSNKAGANSIRGLMFQMETQLASNTRYSIPSHGGNVDTRKTGDYKHTAGYDAWELGDALVGEGLAQDLYKIEPDHKDFNTSQYKKMTTDFKENYVDKGIIPIGAIVFQGNSKRSDYTDPKYGNRSSHGTTVVGFDKEGLPLIYDNGKLKPITEPLLSINRVVIPKGYENYTFTNLKQGKKQHVESLGYDLDEVGDPKKYEDNPDFKPYVNKIYKGINKVKGKIGVDYNIESDVMDKLSKRVVGIGGKETNFGNYGDENVSTLRQLAIETESGLTSSIGKPIMKGLKNLMDMPMAIAQSAMPQDQIKPDWKIEMMAYNNVNGNMDLFTAEYNKLREKYQKPVVLDDAGSDSSSVGVFAMKKLPEYAKDELGLTKGKLYGADVADDKEFSRGAQASLVHMVESYTELKRRFGEKFQLTDDELVDLATVAYNSGGKAYDEDFIQFYIKDKKMPDNYLTKTKKLEQKYGFNAQEKELAIQKEKALEQAKRDKELARLKAMYKKSNEEEIAAYRPPLLPDAQAESTATNDVVPAAYRADTLLQRINPTMDKLRQGMLASATNTSISRKLGGAVYKELSQDEIDQYKMGGWIVEDIE